MSEALFTAGRQFLVAPDAPLIAIPSKDSNGGGNGGGGNGGNGGGGPSGLENILIIGGGSQSNWNYAFSIDGAVSDYVRAVGFYLQSAYATLGGYANDGIGLFNLTTPDKNGQYSGSYVNNSDAVTTLALFNDSRFGNIAAAENDAAILANEVKTASPGTAGVSYQSYVNGLSAAQVSGVSAIVCYWGETDSIQFTPISRELFKACVIRWMSLVRGMFGKSVSALPFFWFGPPYGPSGTPVPNMPATIREIWAEVAADPAQNAFFIVPQTYDTMSRSATQSMVTGLVSDTKVDFGHRAASSNVLLFRRAAIASARAILAANGIAASTIPASLGSGLGPRISSASLAGNIVTATIAHDGGTDLVVPLLAAQGVGFSVMDGGSVASPGPIIQATSCARVNATTLSITLASAPASATGARRLFYPWPQTYNMAQPYSEIGPGCAVTDNFASTAKPSAFDINLSLGNGWGNNMPLQPPITVSGTGPSAAAEWGIAF